MRTFYALALIFAIAGFGTTQTAERRPTILNPVQVPPVPQSSLVIGESLQPGTVANTWTLSKPVTNGIDVFWNGSRQSVPGTYTLSGNGAGGTLLTLSPTAIAANYWTGTDLTATYQ